ncbi:BadF-type ATPase [Nonomuraea solani]|uniref:BadF-type ATPase n=1 Tax=Nonomuraea solani TaxID=1144553 RepID=A0A1H5T828_9ACTN|nr:BadF/BadG/BcrA/BcrD ATPase family protein [Nonomuraea solani]SEF58975.1 BadF-type ATPase [Nonomuraea solani]
MHVVLGIDAGGTSSRAALFTMDGEPLRRGQAGGANPGALGLDRAAANLSSAVRAALADITFPQVKAIVVGLAGNPELCGELTARVFGSLPVRTVGDVVTAFAAGTASPSGTVLISGTGAIAAKITGHEVTATADGYGWQLGDEGSAFWLGRAAARATIRALDTKTDGDPKTALDTNTDGDPKTDGALAGLVVRRLLPEGTGDDPVARLAAVVQARPPLALAELAPLVSRAALDGDPVAVAIVAEAAERLARTARKVREPGLPTVLAGSVLTAEGPVRDAVQGLLEGASVAGDAAGAAAWLAARPFLNSAESCHARFVRPQSMNPAGFGPA